MKKKISTRRNWQLTTEIVDDCIDITEHHEGPNGECRPYVSIPIESIDSIIESLEIFKEQQEGRK